MLLRRAGPRIGAEWVARGGCARRRALSWLRRGGSRRGPHRALAAGERSRSHSVRAGGRWRRPRCSAEPRLARCSVGERATLSIRRVEYDIEREIKALGQSGLPRADWIVKTLLAAAPQMP
jgi:hypothetical protein